MSTPTNLEAILSAYNKRLETKVAELESELSDATSNFQESQEDVAVLTEELELEKKRRIYYQDIAYHVCNVIDSMGLQASPIVCGTVESPSQQVRITMNRIAMMIKERPTPKEAVTINVGDRFRCVNPSISNGRTPVNFGDIGTVSQICRSSVIVKFYKFNCTFYRDYFLNDFEKLPDHPSPKEAVTINVGDEFVCKNRTTSANNADIHVGDIWTVIQLLQHSVFMRSQNEGCKFDKDTILNDFEKIPDPLNEKANEIAKETMFLEKNQTILADLIKSHFSNWSPNE